MKKISTVATKQKKHFPQQKLTIGLDLGDRWSWYCVLDEAGKIRLVAESRKKDDRLDAQTLARLARIDPELLYPVKHRSVQAQADLSVIRARAGLVRARTGLVN